MAACPCGSSREYEECCQPFHKGAAQAPSAEALMRARYSAYVLGEIDYLVRSIPLLERKKFDRRSAKLWSQSAEWKGLEVRSVTEKANGTRAVIEFVARFAAEGEDHAHHEIASFEKVNDRWYFLDGKLVETEPTA